MIFVNTLIKSCPGNSGVLLRKLFYGYFWGQRDFIIAESVNIFGLRNIVMGKGARFCPASIISASSGQIVFGDNFFANFNCCISADCGKITFGNNCLLGPNVVIINGNHNFSDKNILIKDQGHSYKDIIIGNDVWIGANVIILPGVSVGDGAVIGAGSVITKSVESYSVVVGNPQRVIGNRT